MSEKQEPNVDRDWEQIDPNLRQAIASVIHDNGPWPLVLIGPVGCGKTCAALCVCDRYGGDARYYTASKLGTMVADAKCGRLCYPGGSPRSEHALFDDLSRYRLVAIDELGLRGTPTESEFDGVKRLLDLRPGKPLVLVSNLSIGELASTYDERIVSRMSRGTVLAMSGEDRRLAG